MATNSSQITVDLSEYKYSMTHMFNKHKFNTQSNPPTRPKYCNTFK